MVPALLIARVLLAAVFATAGIAKLRDLPGSRSAVAEFGVPTRLAGALGTLLPLAELSIALGLIAHITAPVAALAALSLLLAFAVAIVWNLGRGRVPDCHCFGQLHSSPAGWRTVARNLVLGAVAALVAIELAGTALTLSIAGAGIGGLVVLAPLAWSRARADRAGASAASGPAVPEGLPLGAPAPGFLLPALSGETVSLDSLRELGRPVLLVFSDPNCGPCLTLAPKLARWQRRHADELTIAVIERRDGSNGASPDEHGRRNILLQRESEVSDAYRAQGTPTAVLVGSDGAIASPVAAGAVEIEALVTRNVRGLGRLSSAATQRRREPPGLGRPLIRRELLGRGAAAWATATAVLASPGRAGATLRTREGGCGRSQFPCGSKCCDEGTEDCRDTKKGKRCACASEYPDRCPGYCTDLDSDSFNCHECRRNCPPNTTCTDGECVGGDGSECPGMSSIEICCEGKAVDPDDDKNNCGGCGRHCKNRDETGAIVREPTCCFGKCVDFQSDPFHCGHCIERCRGEKELCYRGECIKECPQGLRRCPKSGPGTCGQPQSQICCGGKLYSREETSECCNGKPCPPPDAPPDTQGYWYCRFGKCICAIGEPYGPCP